MALLTSAPPPLCCLNPLSNKSEVSLWLPDGVNDDPLSRYKLVDKLQAPEAQKRYPGKQIAVKSMVMPDYIQQYHIHWATALKTHQPTEIDPVCMALVSCFIYRLCGLAYHMHLACTFGNM